MHKYLLLGAGLMLFSIRLLAQSGSNFLQIHTQNINMEADVRHVRHMPNGDLLIQGQYENAVVFDTVTTQGPGANQYLMRLNPNRKVKWVKTFGNNSFVNPYFLEINNNGKIFLGGTFQDSLTFNGQVSLTGSPFGSFLLELDSTGAHSRNISVTNNPNQPFIRDLSTHNSGKTYYFSANDSVTLFGQGYRPNISSNEFGIVVHEDLSGNISSNFTLESSGQSRIFESSSLKNGDCIVVMSTTNSDSLRIANQIITHTPRTGLWVLRIGNQGSLKDSAFLKVQGFARFDLTDESSTGKLLLKGLFTGNVSHGSFSIANSNQPNPNFLSDAAYLILDQNLNIQALNSLGIVNNNTSISDAQFYGANEEIIVTGDASGSLLFNGDPTFFSTGGDTETYIIRLNPDGTLNRGMRTQGIGPLIQIQSNGLLINPDNTFSVYGEANSDFTIYEGAADTLRRRSLRVGYIWNFSNFVNLPEWQPFLYREKLSVYPNPAEQRLYLQNASARPIGQREYRLLDLQGHLLQKGLINESGVNVQDLAPGIYLLSVPNNRGEWHSYKFIKGE